MRNAGKVSSAELLGKGDSSFAVDPTSIRLTQAPDLGRTERLQIFGQVLVQRQRSSTLVCRTRAPDRSTLPTSWALRAELVESTFPPGSAKRRFRSMFRPEIFGFVPSQTLRPASSWLNPSITKSLKNVPDCELPSEMDQLIRPATGFGVRLRPASRT